MTRVTAPPFSTLRKQGPVVEWSHSTAADQVLSRGLPSTLAPWDAQVDLRVRVDALLHSGPVMDELRLGEGACLRLSLSWYSRGTQARDSLASTEVIEGTPPSLSLEGTIRGGEIARSVEVSLLLTLVDPGSRPDPLAAGRPGSLVWKTTEIIGLESNLGGFPVMWVEFDSADHLPGRAAWYLDWDPSDLEQELDHGTRLLLNSDHDILREALAYPGELGSKPVLEFLYHDLGRILITGVLRNVEEGQSAASFPPGSLGARVLGLTEALFPGRSSYDLKRRMLLLPDTFHRDLQDRLRILQALP